MPRYFFHLRENGTLAEDQQGARLPSLRAARDRAIEGARRIIGDAVREGRLPLDYQFEIADETRETVLVVSFMEAVDLQSVHAIPEPSSPGIRVLRALREGRSE